MVLISSKESLSQIDSESYPNFLSVLTIQEEDAKLISVEDLLEKETSIQIRKFGGLGSSSSISIRGSSPNQVKVFIDGIPVALARSGSADLSHLSLDEFSAIEIYRGAAPASFGSSPIGGAVNLITKKVSSSEHALKFSVGSFGTLKTGLESHLHREKVQLFLSASHTESDGDYDFTDDRRTPDNPNDDIERVRQNNDLDQNHLFTKFNYKRNEDISFNFSNSYLNKKQGLAGRANLQTTHVRSQTQRNLTTIGVNIGNRNEDTSHYTLTFSRLQLKEKYKDTFGSSGELGLGKQDNNNKTGSYDFKLGFDKVIHDHWVEMTYLFKRENYRPYDELLTFQFPKSHRINHEIGIQDTMRFLNETIIFVPSIRYQLVQNRIRKEASGIHNFSNNQDNREFSHKWGLTFIASETLKLKSNISTAIRQPTLIELFGDRGTTTGNQDLKFEESLNTDIGFDWNPNYESKAIQNFNLRSAYFLQKRENLIQFVFDARGVGQAINISEGKVNGFEISNSFDIFRHFKFSQNLTLIDSEITSSQFSTDIGKQIPGIYEKTYQTKLSYTYRAFKMSYELLAQDQMFYDKTNLIQAANKNLHHLALHYKWKKLLLFFDIKNLTDEQVEDYNGWPLPGRTYLLSFKYHL